jgi:hypothetical protein
MRRQRYGRLSWPWAAGLGLRLGPRGSGDHVLGWKIETAAPSLIILSVRSLLLGSAHMLFQVENERVLLASFVRYETRVARPLWSAVQPLHHRIVPYLLAHAAAHPRAPEA